MRVLWEANPLILLHWTLVAIHCSILDYVTRCWHTFFSNITLVLVNIDNYQTSCVYQLSSALLLHDSLHSLFTPVCLSVTRQRALHVLLKEFLNLSFPVRKAGVSDLSISTAHGFFWRLFVYYCFVSVRAQEKNTTSLVLWPCRVPTCVVLWNLLIKPTVPA